MPGKRKRFPAFWWGIHNLIAHPVSEILYWFGLERAGSYLHDETIPEHEEGKGRG